MTLLTYLLAWLLGQGAIVQDPGNGTPDPGLGPVDAPPGLTFADTLPESEALFFQGAALRGLAASGGGVQPGGLFGLQDELALRVRARGEFGGDWTRFRPCDPSFQITCNPGLIPQLQPDLLLSVEAAGTLAGRIVVDVDYDQTRDFAGANRIQAHYEGAGGEFLQRVEVGDITFALPASRYLTRGIPAGNFGVLARAEAGGVEMQTVFAQQQGARRHREFRLGTVGGEIGVATQDTVVVDDSDYVRGQFFFLVDPNRLPDAPHLDVLSLRPGNAPPDIGPGPEPIQLYRMERTQAMRQQVEGYIQAQAVAGEGTDQVRESGWFRYLRPGVDYYLHPSGLWVALRTPLGPDEALAVTYLNALGDSIGTYNPERLANQGIIPTLRLLRSTRAQHQPGRAAWDFEMKQVYRVSGSDEVDLHSVSLDVSLGEISGGRTFKESPFARRIPLLRLFGLDEESPTDVLDRRALFQPARELPEVRGAVSGTFLVFPTLRPFLEPPPVPSEGLDAETARAILGLDANRRIYEASDPFERRAASLYRLNFDVRTRSAGVTTVVALGAFGIRQGSERIYLGDRLLVPDLDYLMDYDLGVVTLVRPEGLIARSSSDRLRVSWEQASVFRPAPTSVVGWNAGIPVAEAGRIDLIGLYQIERELVNRPRFGAEPAAVGMLGVRTELEQELRFLDGLFDRFSRRPEEGGPAPAIPSRVRLEAEVATSLPDPNVSGAAFIDDFDAAEGRIVSLISTFWHLGSRPEFRTGAEAFLPNQLSEENVASLTWQHTWVDESAQGDSLGIVEGFLTQDEIDREIRFAGSQSREPGMRVTFGAQQRGRFGGPRWRSLTTVLSPTGADLTQTEFLEVYVARGEGATLIFDLGLVSEDAFFVDARGQTSGIRPETGRPWGIGTLDQEADPLLGEIWGPEKDRLGLWPEDCLAEPGRVYRPGNPNANCTRGNGRRDTEDLNQNGVLDTTERYRRYVVHLDGSSPWLVRTSEQTGTAFQLYRIPLRGPGALDPGGAFTEADWRAVQFLRLTMAGTAANDLTLARMRLVGSRWIKRNVEGVLRGIAGDTLDPRGSLEVTSVSVLSEGEAYQAPPGVLEELDDPASAVGGRGVEFNEKSLGFRYEGIEPEGRAEVYLRFLQRPSNFLNYSRLRVWTVARSGDWGSGVPSYFFLKVGSDPENFYLYRSRLDPAANPEAVRSADWLPEHRIEFDEWIDLRRRAEERLLRDPPGPGDPPVEVWSVDSTYAIVLRDRARAPNLGAVREVSMGVWNRNGFASSGELWVNELRLGGGVRRAGSAGMVNVEFDGGELLQARFGYTGREGDFRQLDEASTFQFEGEYHGAATLQAGALLPAGWGVEMPVTVSHQRSSSDPFFLEGTDLRAVLLPGLRETSFRDTRIATTVRVRGETGVTLLDRVLPGADLRVAFHRAQGSAVTSETGMRGSELGAGYRLDPGERTFGLLPGVLEPVARVLLPPGWVRSLRATRVRWTPEFLGVTTGLRRQEREVTRFNEIRIVEPVDPGFTEFSREAWLDSGVRLRMRPLPSLAAEWDLRTTRDVLDTPDGVRDPATWLAVDRERVRLLGIDTGWETGRVLRGRVTWRPPLPPWMRADFGAQTRYRSDRGAGFVRSFPGEAPELVREAGSERDLRATVTFEPRLVASALGWPGAEEGGRAGLLASWVSPVNISVQNGIFSWYSREAVRPGSSFQLGLGGIEGFARVDGVDATRLLDRRAVSAGSGLNLPGSLFWNVNLQTNRERGLDRRAERTGRVRSWPDMRAGVTALPLPAEWEGRVERVTVSTGWQRVTEEVSFGEALQQDRRRSDLRVPVEFVVVWGGGVETRYRGLFARGEGSDPLGSTERVRNEHGFSIETRLSPRGGLAERVQEPLRVSLVVNWIELDECRATTSGDACVPFVEQRERGASFALDTRVAELEVGSLLSLLDSRSFTGFQMGQTRFQMSVWARMVFESGPLARLEGRPTPF